MVVAQEHYASLSCLVEFCKLNRFPTKQCIEAFSARVVLQAYDSIRLHHWIQLPQSLLNFDDTLLRTTAKTNTALAVCQLVERMYV